MIHYIPPPCTRPCKDFYSPIKKCNIINFIIVLLWNSFLELKFGFKKIKNKGIAKHFSITHENAALFYKTILCHTKNILVTFLIFINLIEGIL